MIKVLIRNIRGNIMNKRGFSIPELMIALAIASVIGMASYTIFSSSNRTYKVQEDVVEAQQNLRMAMDRISKDIRGAGFGLPNPPFTITIGTQTFTAPVTVANNSAGVSPEAPNTDTITLVGLGYEVATLVNQGVNLCSNGIGCNTAGANCLCIDKDDSLFSGASVTVISTRKYITIGGEAYLELIDGPHDRAKRILKLDPATLLHTYPDSSNTKLCIIQAVKYNIDLVPTVVGGVTTTIPVLMMEDYTGLRGSGRNIFADYIEDMQFAYGLDGTIGPDFKKDGKVDDKNGNGTFDEKDFRFSEVGDAAIDDTTSIMAVRVSLVARARNGDLKAGNVFNRPALEDRAAGAKDNIRRRVLSSIVKLRNPKVGGH